MLRAYCLEFERGWDEGVPLLLFPIRDVTQESTDFSSAELVFGHTVRGPLKFLKERWLANDSSPTTNLLDYVIEFRCKLSRACKLARENLCVSQRKMKKWYDSKVTVSSEYFLQLIKFLFCYHCQFQLYRLSTAGMIDHQVGPCNYLVKAPERR